jgi:hypothetical protein
VKLLRGCAALVLLVIVVVAGFWAYSALHRGQAARAVVTPSSAAPTAAAPAAAPTAVSAANVAQRLVTTESAIRQSAAAGKHQPYSVTITEAELNALIAQSLVSGQVQAPVSDVSTAIQPGQVVVSGQAKVGVLSAPFTMTAVPRAAAGKAQLQVSGATFSGVAMPSAMSSQLLALFDSNNLLGDLPLTVTSFQANQGALVLQGTT